MEKFSRRDFLKLGGLALVGATGIGALIANSSSVEAKAQDAYKGIDNRPRSKEVVEMENLMKREYLSADEVKEILSNEAGDLGEDSEKLLRNYIGYFNALSVEADQGEYDGKKMVKGLVLEENEEFNYETPWLGDSPKLDIAYLYIFKDSKTGNGLLLFRNKEGVVITLQVEPWEPGVGHSPY